MEVIWAVVATVGQWVCRGVVQVFLSLVGMLAILTFIAVFLLGVDALINRVF